jgi:hypothetical protein
MSVSHYVVSILSLVGLGATALGSCYAMQNVPGKTANKFLRSLLLALPPVLLYIVSITLGIYGQWRVLDPQRFSAAKTSSSSIIV